MVIGGEGANDRALGDVWLLDVDKRVWSKVGMLPDYIASSLRV